MLKNPLPPTPLPAMDSIDLRRVGLKVTLPRVRILEILEQSPQKHMTAEDVFKVLLEGGEDIGLATVYRVLNQFAQAGLVERRNFEAGQAMFELADGSHHDHMICLDTGKVIEFYDADIERRQHEIAEAHGYELEEHSLVLYVRKKREVPSRR